MSMDSAGAPLPGEPNPYSEAMSPGAAEEGSAARDAESRTVQLWRRIDNWLEKASDWLNPILVKETRQSLKSNQFVIWFLLLLAACWLVTMFGLMFIGPAIHYSASGGVMFMAYYTILSFPLTVIVPFGAYRSLTAEQEDNTRDVLMVSALTPYQVINGKLGSAALQVVVYFSALSPCLAFTYLLRGIDLATIVLLPTFAVLFSLGLSMLALLMASASRQRFAQVLTSVVLISGLLLAFWMCVVVGRTTLFEGAMDFQSVEFQVAVGAMLNAYLCVFLLAYFSAAGLNTFSSANRSTAIRRVLFFSQACFVGWVAGIWIWSDYEVEIPLFSLMTLVIFWYVTGTLLTSEGPVLSERVRRGLPATTLGRVLGTWFNPGPGTGFFFVISNTCAACLLTASVVLIWGGLNYLVDLECLCFILLCFSYHLGYLGLGRLVIGGLRKFAKISALGCFLIHFLLLLMFIGTPELVRTLFVRFGRSDYAWFDVPSPFRSLASLLDSDLAAPDLVLLIVVVPGFALCILLVNLAATAREIRQTRAPLPQRVIEDEAELRPVEETIANPWGDLKRAE